MNKQERRNCSINSINKMGYKNKSRICWNCPDRKNNCHRKCVYKEKELGLKLNNSNNNNNESDNK